MGASDGYFDMTGAVKGIYANFTFPFPLDDMCRLPWTYDVCMSQGQEFAFLLQWKKPPCA